MKYYALAKKISQTYGHGDHGEEIHICPKDAYMGDMSFHPIFETKEEAESYKNELKWNHDMKVIELNVHNAL